MGSIKSHEADTSVACPKATAQHRYQTIPPTSKSREAAQEALVNEMLGFGRQTQSQSTCVRSASYELQCCEVDGSDPFSTPTRSRRTSQVVASEYDMPQQQATKENISSGDRAQCLHVPSSPEPEEFYRSSAEYVAARAEWQKPLQTGRPLTPYPREAKGLSNRASRPYASVPLSSSQRQAAINDAVTVHAPNTSHPPLRRRHGVRRPKTPPPRLPADYRARKAFSFDRPPTTTPFSTQGARPMSPSHWLYNAPRVGGVELEVRALQQATENRTSVHRALWPEERAKVLGEIDNMAKNLIRGAGVVVGVREDQIVEETDEQEELTKKKRFGWLKKLWFKKKETQPGAALPTVGNSASPHQALGNPLQAHHTPGRAPYPGPSSSVTLKIVSSAGREQRQGSTSTSFEARSSTTAATPSHSRAKSVNSQAVSRFASPRSPRHDANKRSRAWWHFYSRRTLDQAPGSQKSLRQQTVQRKQRERLRQVQSNRKIRRRLQEP
jgi:hypothetical protein